VKDNIGETGVKSVRINTKRIEELPLGQGNQAKEQIADAIETERLNAVAEVRARYPSHRVDYLVGRINECEENKNRIKRLRTSQLEMVTDYQRHLSNCRIRDKLLEALEENKERISDEMYKEERKRVMRDWGYYQIDGLEAQIVQCNEAIERCEAILEQENASINEHTHIITLCKQRDKELAKLGESHKGS